MIEVNIAKENTLQEVKTNLGTSADISSETGATTFALVKNVIDKTKGIGDLLGTASPTVGDNTNVMNYLKKVETDISKIEGGGSGGGGDGTITGTDGFKYKINVKEHYDLTNTSIYSNPAILTPNRVDPGVGNARASKLGNVVVTSNGIYSFEGQYIVRRDLKTLVELAKSVLITTTIAECIIRSHGDNIYTFDATKQSVLLLNALDLTVSFTKNIASALTVSISVTDNGFYIMTYSRKIFRLSLDDLTELGSYTTNSTRDAGAPFCNEYGVAQKTQNRPIEGSEMLILDPITMAVTSERLGLAPNTYTAGSTTETGYIYSDRGIIACNSKGFILHMQGQYYENSATIKSTDDIFHIFNNMNASFLSIEVTGNISTSDIPHYTIETSQTGFIIYINGLTSSAKGNKYLSQRWEIVWENEAFIVKNHFVSSNLIDYKKQYLVRDFKDNIYLDTIGKEYPTLEEVSFRTGDLTRSVNTALKPLLYYDNSLYADKGGVIYRIPKTWKFIDCQRVEV